MKFFENQFHQVIEKSDLINRSAISPKKSTKFDVIEVVDSTDYDSNDDDSNDDDPSDDDKNQSTKHLEPVRALNSMSTVSLIWALETEEALQLT